MGPFFVADRVIKCRYNKAYEITFDAPKYATNRAKHEFDFADLTAEWIENATISKAKLGRFRDVGEFRGQLVAVFFKPLGSEALSIISMRPASRKERREHDQV